MAQSHLQGFDLELYLIFAGDDVGQKFLPGLSGHLFRAASARVEHVGGGVKGEDDRHTHFSEDDVRHGGGRGQHHELKLSTNHAAADQFDY